MHTDFAVLTGTHHTAKASACQDYCVAGMTRERAYAIVADGCSQAGETDLGARAWALGARRLIKSDPFWLGVPGQLGAMIADHANELLNEIDFDDGYATVLLLDAADRQVRATFF